MHNYRAQGVSLKLNAWDKNITFFQVVGLIGLIRLIWMASSETTFLGGGFVFLDRGFGILSGWLNLN